MTMDSPYTARDFDQSPFVLFYEVTRACDLVCRHCRACAQTKAHPDQLSTLRAKRLIEQIARFPRPPLLVFTGGDPLKREDIFDLVNHAREVDLTTAMTPSATPLVTVEALARLQRSGVSRLAMSLDGVDAPTHDAFRGAAGSYDRTFRIMADARAIGLPLQVNTTVTQRNMDQLDAIAELLTAQQIVLWSVFFLIPVGRGVAERRLNALQCEEVFERLWRQAQRQPYAIKTTEAHHYRRFVLQRRGDPQGGSIQGRAARAPLGVNDGKGVMFVSHVGRIHPSGFMPISCGRFPADNVVDVYQNAPLFRQLRNPDLFEGKCGVCEFRKICGGSRARAYAVTGDPLGSEPDCIYIPKATEAIVH